MKIEFISIALATLCCLLSPPETAAQLSIGGTPFGFTPEFRERYPVREIPVLTLKAPNVPKLLAEDEANGTPNRFAVNLPLGCTFDNSGSWVEMENGDRIWSVRIHVPGARTLHLTYDVFSLPDEAYLYLYTEDAQHVLGGFSSFNNPDGGDFATAILPGDAIVLEYYEPAEVRGMGSISVSNVCYGYKNLEPVLADLACNYIDVKCPLGNNWQEEKRGVVVYQIQTNTGAGFCSGSLVNNTARDKKPYVLSARHCVTGNGTPQYGQFIFYFNYELTGCGSGQVSPNYASLTGCLKRSEGTASDFLLMEIDEGIPASPYQPYFNGWSRNTSAPASTVGISHPDGGCKKIHADNQAPTVYNTNFWQVQLDQGQFTFGSSGSPLFDPSGHIRGQLSTGGPAPCMTVGNYGMLSKSWDPPNSGCQNELKIWLAPDATNPTSLSGLEGACFAGGPVERLNARALGRLSVFFSGEMHHHVRDLMTAYIRHSAEIEPLFQPENKRSAALLAALETVKNQCGKLYLRAFVFGLDNVLTDKQLEPLRRFFEEMLLVTPGEDLKKELRKLLMALPSLEGKDLKSALLAYDRMEEGHSGTTSTASVAGTAYFDLFNTAGETPVLHFMLRESGLMHVQLVDAKGNILRTLMEQPADAGRHELPIPKGELPGGLYFAVSRFEGASGAVRDIKKIVWTQ